MFTCGCSADVSFGQMRSKAQSLYCYIAEHLFWVCCSLTWASQWCFHNFRSGGFSWWGGVGDLAFLLCYGRMHFQISEHVAPGSVHVSKCDNKHIWVMVGSWGVVSRCSKAVWAHSPAQAHRPQLRAELWSCGVVQPQNNCFAPLGHSIIISSMGMCLVGNS